MDKKNEQRSIFHDILLALIPTISIFVLTILADNYHLDKATIYLGSPVVINGKQYQPIDFDNYSLQPDKVIQIRLPSNVNLSEITNSTPIAIDLIKSLTNNKKIIGISSFPLSSKSRILIATDTKIETDDIINAIEHSVEIIDDHSIPAPERANLIASGINATLMFVMFLILSIFDRQRANNLRSEIDKLNSHIKLESKSLQEEFDKERNNIYLETKELREQVTDQLQQIENVRITATRTRVFLLRRISEYKKEILFWRNAVKAHLKIDKDDSSFDLTTKKISRQLGTMSTHSKSITDEADQLIQLLDVAQDVKQLVENDCSK